MPEWACKSWKLKIQFRWIPSIILQYIASWKESIDILHLNAKILYVQKHLQSFQEPWNFSLPHSSRTAYTTRLVRHCHNIISPLISVSKKHTMKFSANTWNKILPGCPNHFERHCIYIKSLFIRSSSFYSINTLI